MANTEDLDNPLPCIMKEKDGHRMTHVEHIYSAIVDFYLVFATVITHNP